MSSVEGPSQYFHPCSPCFPQARAPDYPAHCGISQVHSQMWCRWLYTICVLFVCFVLLTIRQTLAVRHQQVEAKGEDVAGGGLDEQSCLCLRLSEG